MVSKERAFLVDGEVVSEDDVIKTIEISYLEPFSKFCRLSDGKPGSVFKRETGGRHVIRLGDLYLASNLETAPELPHGVVLTDEEEQMILDGNGIGMIKSVRNRTGIYLRQGVDVLNSYKAFHDIK